MMIEIPLDKLRKLQIRINLVKKERLLMNAIVDRSAAIEEARKLYSSLFDEKRSMWFGEYATNLDKVLNHLKLEVFVSDLSEHVQDNEKLEGFLLKNNETYTIGIDKNEQPRRQRFTVAHEIGHFVLNHLKDQELSVSFRSSFSSSISDPKERAANSFAAELLMPAKLFEHAFILHGSVSKVADLFNVSEEAARRRTAELGLAGGG